jgi:Reverse transcriptase (RNA-dependent DNA polymerase)
VCNRVSGDVLCVTSTKELFGNSVIDAELTELCSLKTRGDDAEKVIIKELLQMAALKVREAKRAQDMTAAERAGVIRSSMFLKRKTHPDGSFDKYKARLVAGGNMQDKKLYEDLSSPTVSTSSVFTIASIAAHEKRHVAVVDIESAFLNATIQKSVYMRLDKTMSEYLVSILSALSSDKQMAPLQYS